jgi:signal transduction histidine kinase
MNKLWSHLNKKYQKILHAYLVREGEEQLQKAYDLGRHALSRGCGVLDMVRLHHETLIQLIAFAETPAVAVARAVAGETFLLEALSPFEVAHRGFRKAWKRLRQLNETLERRNQALAAINKKLKGEILERRKAEKALRKSKEHYEQLFEQAHLMEENLRQLSNKLISVQEEERKNISRELHDEIGQALTAVTVSIAMLKKHDSRDPAFAKKVTVAQELLEQSMETAHRFARELRPPMLDYLGLHAVLHSYGKSFSERTGIKTVLRSGVRLDRLDSQQGLVLYRVAQESLTNVFKHAQATLVQIRFRRIPRGICMEIKDNGRAFRTQGQPNGHVPQRLGLLGMQERVRLINGEFAVESRPGQGTTVRVQIPLIPARKRPGKRSGTFLHPNGLNANHPK